MFGERAHVVPVVYLANISNNPTAAMRHTWLVGWFKVAKAEVVTPRPNWGILKESTRDTSPSSSSLLHPRLFRGSLRRGELLLGVVRDAPRRTVEILLERLQPSRIGVTVRHKDNLQQRNAILSRILHDPHVLCHLAAGNFASYLLESLLSSLTATPGGKMERVLGVKSTTNDISIACHARKREGKDIITSLSPSGKLAVIKGGELRATKWRRAPPCAEADRLIASTKSHRTKSITAVYLGNSDFASPPRIQRRRHGVGLCAVVVRMNHERGSKSFRTPLLTCHTCARNTHIHARAKTKGDDPADDSNFHRGPLADLERGELLKHFLVNL
ncbi:hypothetical protein ALC56_07762 [Trachymyrmex septentrionalis]|uniref:Uncharacterized protein n=1 Tax=Trachymyrmex septentrionalis TaxID=34720 RepID=A0A195FBY1_9HYME|nr:hypothetical protein ALC56_07762 [Trachymyrmex septentrionalis]